MAEDNGRHHCATTTALSGRSSWQTTTHISLVRSLDIAAAVTDFLASGLWPCYAEKVIHSVVLDDAAALMQSIGLATKLQHLVYATFLHAGEVGFQFYEVDVSAAGEYIYPTVIIKEEG